MRVDIWSDVVCPWCYIGKRRFDAALAQFEHADDVEVVWRSFELRPNAPHSDTVTTTYVERLAQKYGTSLAQAQLMVDRMIANGAEEGLELRFDRIHPGNTFDAHRLLHLALERGVQDDFKERLDRGTFTDGLSVSNHEALTAVAVEAGLDPDEVGEVLASDQYADAVRGDEARAEELFITGVPCFVAGGRSRVPGAQPADELLLFLRRAWSAHQSETARR